MGNANIMQLFNIIDRLQSRIIIALAILENKEHDGCA